MTELSNEKSEKGKLLQPNLNPSLYKREGLLTYHSLTRRGNKGEVRKEKKRKYFSKKKASYKTLIYL